jgi:cation transport ATPase
MKHLDLKLGELSDIDRAIAHEPRVEESNVDFALEPATIRSDRQATTAETMIQTVRTAGDRDESALVDARVLPGTSLAAIPKPNIQIEKLKIDDLKLSVAIVVWVLLIIGSLPMILNRDLTWIPTWLQQPLWQLILLIPVQFWCGRTFLLSASNAARQGRINLSTLVAVITGATYFDTLLCILAPQLLIYSSQLPPAMYADISAGAIALMLVGEKLERQIKMLPRSGVSKLIKLSPSINRIVENRLADRLSRRFVPLVILAAIVTASLWLSLTGNLSIALITGFGVIIIGCPSTLGLAAATAISAGIKQSLKWGTLIHNGASLELLQQANIIVFDRSGVLTVGKPVFTDFIPIIDKYHGDELAILQLVASLEARAEHPFAAAIVDRAKERKISLKSVSQFQTIVGSGVQGIIDNKLIQVGSSEWIASLNICTVNQVANYQILTNYQQQWEADGKAVIWIAIDSEIAGIISISDSIKSTAIATISKLKKLGLEIILLTEECPQTARKLAWDLGIVERSDRACQQVFAQIQPEDKVEVIRALQSTYIGKHRAIVAMVGRNIDNVAALAQSDIGIVMGTEIEPDLFTGDITISDTSLSALLNTIRLSRSTSNTIKQNLFLAVVYHLLIGIPIASGLFNLCFDSAIAASLPIGLTILSAGSIFLNTYRRRFKS